MPLRWWFWHVQERLEKSSPVQSREGYDFKEQGE